MNDTYDVIVIGGGTAGINAAHAAADAGAQVVLVNDGPTVTACAAKNCMPSKALLAATHVAHTARHSEPFGVLVDGPVSADFGRIVAQVREQVQIFTQSVERGVEKAEPGLTLWTHAQVTEVAPGPLGVGLTYAIEQHGQRQVQVADKLMVAAGYMVHEALKAVAECKAQGIEATLVDLYSLPFDAVALLKLAQRCNGNVVTVEDNYGAGVGTAVASVLAEHGSDYTFKQMFVRHIPKSGRSPDEVLRYLKLSATDIVRTAVRMLAATSP